MPDGMERREDVQWNGCRMREVVYWKGSGPVYCYGEAEDALRL